MKRYAFRHTERSAEEEATEGTLSCKARLEALSHATECDFNGEDDGIQSDGAQFEGTQFDGTQFDGIQFDSSRDCVGNEGVIQTLLIEGSGSKNPKGGDEVRMQTARSRSRGSSASSASAGAGGSGRSANALDAVYDVVLECGPQYPWISMGALRVALPELSLDRLQRALSDWESLGEMHRDGRVRFDEQFL